MADEKKAAFYFKFYPGDYLRDTQNLSEKAQVAYDRIMCEHMRNICLSYAQHKFFTKRLNEEEREELLQVLEDTGEGFVIRWVVDSIHKARAYSKSRSEIREGKTKEKKENHMKSYDNHMESNSSSNSNSIKKTKKDTQKMELVFPCPEMEGIWQNWTDYKKAQHKETYKTTSSAQIAINNLWSLADKSPATALEIINHSKGNLWKGFFKPNHNGKNQQHKPNPLASFNRAAKDAIEAERLLAERQGDGGDLFTEVYGQASRLNVRD